MINCFHNCLTVVESPAFIFCAVKRSWKLQNRGMFHLEATIPADMTVFYTARSKGSDILLNLLLKRDANVQAKPSRGEPAIFRDNFKSL